VSLTRQPFGGKLAIAESCWPKRLNRALLPHPRRTIKVDDRAISVHSLDVPSALVDGHEVCSPGGQNRYCPRPRATQNRVYRNSMSAFGQLRPVSQARRRREQPFVSVWLKQSSEQLPAGSDTSTCSRPQGSRARHSPSETLRRTWRANILFFERSRNMEPAKWICVDTSSASRAPALSGLQSFRRVSGRPLRGDVSHAWKADFNSPKKSLVGSTCGASYLRDHIAGYQLPPRSLSRAGADPLAGEMASWEWGWAAIS
jgi:hypothetical protein